MSQRLLSTLLVLVMFAVGGVVAFVQHTLPPLSDISANLLTFVAPVVGVFYVLNKWLDTVDSKVADGSIQPGEIRPLLTMPDFYAAMVACLAGIFQTYGFKLLDADTQTFLVNSILVVVSVLLRSFAERTPSQSITQSQLVLVQKAQAVEDVKKVE
jgi:membrane protein implicated in regulation of membrane protease activity